jgi:hypothetical protein
MGASWYVLSLKVLEVAPDQAFGRSRPDFRRTARRYAPGPGTRSRRRMHRASGASQAPTMGTSRAPGGRRRFRGPGDGRKKPGGNGGVGKRTGIPGTGGVERGEREKCCLKQWWKSLNRTTTDERNASQRCAIVLRCSVPHTHEKFKQNSFSRAGIVYRFCVFYIEEFAFHNL